MCDADSSASGIQDSATGQVAQCVACKMSGENKTCSFLQLSINIEGLYLHKTLMNRININIDRTTPGDGTNIGICPSHYSNYRCLSTGSCNVCGFISGVHQGCDALSTEPICDADSTTSGIQDSAVEKVAQCVGCKKSGKYTKLIILYGIIVLMGEII